MVSNRLVSSQLAIIIDNLTISDGKRTRIDQIISRIRVSKETIYSHRDFTMLYAYEAQTFMFRETRNDCAIIF